MDMNPLQLAPSHASDLMRWVKRCPTRPWQADAVRRHELLPLLVALQAHGRAAERGPCADEALGAAGARAAGGVAPQQGVRQQVLGGDVCRGSEQQGAQQRV